MLLLLLLSVKIRIHYRIRVYEEIILPAIRPSVGGRVKLVVDWQY